MKIVKAFVAAQVLALFVSNAHANPDAETFRADFLAAKLSWDDVRARAANEGGANFYYWGGNDVLNVWIASVVAPALSAEGIKLTSSRIRDTKDAVDLVLAEKNSGKGTGDGSVDAIWVNGKNFYTLLQQNALFGSFAQAMPNSKNFEWSKTDPRSLLNLRDFGVPTDSKEVPWSGEEYVCAVNRQYVQKADTPATYDELRNYLEAHPGKFTYVKPPHYVGDTFVESAIYAHNPDGNGAEPFQKSIDELGTRELARLIAPGLKFLKDLEPLLLGGAQGHPRYPENPAALDGLFLNGEVHFDCKFGMYAVDTGLSTGKLPPKSEEMIFPKGGMIKNKNYLAIPLNSPHPASALVFANYMSSVDAQASKLKTAGNPAGIDAWKLSDEDSKKLGEATPHHHGVTQADLDSNAVPDFNASLVNVIEATWLELFERGSTAPIGEIVEKAAADQKKKR
jgi:putative spermidine/putrescine transport system substrate-binding protein